MAEGEVFGQGNVVQEMSSMGPMSGTDDKGSQSMLNGVNVSGACYSQPPVVGYQQTFSQLCMQPMQHMQTAPSKMVFFEVKHQTQHLTSRNGQINTMLSIQ